MTYKLTDRAFLWTFWDLANQLRVDAGDWGALVGMDVSDEAPTDDLQLDDDQRDRISYLANIVLGLEAVFGAESPAVSAWITTPNVAFEGRSPLTVMLDGGLDGILRVRYYIEMLQ